MELILPSTVDKDGDNWAPIELTPILRNESSAMATVVAIRLYIDTRLEVLDDAGLHRMGTATMRDNGTPVVEYGKTIISPPDVPIWQGLTFDPWGPRKFLVRPPVDQGTFVVGWQLQAPGMEKRAHIYELRTGPETAD